MLSWQLRLPGNQMRTGGSEGEPERQPEPGSVERRGRVKAAAGFSRSRCPRGSGHPSLALPGSPANCLCPHLLGDASGRLRRRQNLFPDPIQRWGLPVRDLHSHCRHRLQGEVAAGSFSSSEPGAVAQARGTVLSSPALASQDCCGSP